MNENNYRGENNQANDSARKAMDAARRAQAHANRAKREAEHEDRLRRDEARQNIPLVSPNKREANSQKHQVRSRRVQQNNSASRPATNGRPATNNRSATNLKSARPNEQAFSSGSGQAPPPNSRQAQHRDGEDNQGVSVFGRLISIILAAVSIAVIAVIFIYNVLPLRYRLTLAVIIVLLNVIVFYLVNRGRYSRSSRIGGNTIGVIALVILLAISYILYIAVSTLDSLNIEYELVNYEVRVMADSSLQSLSDLNNQVIGVANDETEENLNSAYDQLTEEYSSTFTTIKSNNFIENVSFLYSGEVNAILFNSAYQESILAVYPEFETETRVLGTTDVKAPISIAPNRVNTSREGFSMFISGIDTYGDISTVSRSDVNIVVSVNPRTKSILMTSIPRDAYVEIAGTNGGYDKLTHAGIYGIETSVNTVSNFLDTDINYYSRVNFTSLIELVDILGGIEVDNPVAFPTNDGKYYFEAGTIYLDGDSALAFSRERYNLAGGDVDRGQNQLRVIEGMINKVTTREALQNIGPLLDKFNEVAETNMPTPDIMNLVNVSAEGASWDMEKTNLLGTGTTGLPSYSMPGSSLYMYQPDQNSLMEIRTKIDGLLAEK